MRMRFKPYARPELAACPFFISKPEALRGNWASFFEDKNKPIYLELGCGKGRFIAEAATKHPENNYIGLDIKSEVLVLAKRNVQSFFNYKNTAINNVALSSHNIENIGQIFAPQDEVSRIYINFCNPWYKSGHAKHRLTHPRQLIKYRAFLKPQAEIYFKTDDSPLFNASLRYFEYSGFKLLWKSEDLHKNQPEWNVQTEHEKMFAEQGIKIKACIVVMQNAELDEKRLLNIKYV